MNIGKRGFSFPQAILALMGLFIVAVIVATFYGVSQGDDFAIAFESSITKTTDVFMNILTPMLKALLGLSGTDANNDFLMILTFILVCIIVVGTLDSVSIFGGDEKSNLTNFAVGIIVSIIGVRFMPHDMWQSLTAPSSAFVATILVGIPFAAFFFVTMKVESNLARKTLWIFYIVFMSYLIFFPGGSFDGALTGASNDFASIYVIFLLLAGLMMFFDASVRRFIHKEKREAEMETNLKNIDILKRKDIRSQVEKWTAVLTDDGASDDDKRAARSKLTRLRKQYGEDLSVI